jgi:hypothetical protein
LSPRDYTTRPATRTSPAAPGSAGGRGGGPLDTSRFIGVRLRPANVATPNNDQRGEGITPRCCRSTASCHSGARWTTRDRRHGRDGIGR